MNDKGLVERVIAWLDGGCSSWNVPSSDIRQMATRIEALEAENAQMRRQGQDEGFAAAVQELRDMSARKPLPTLWHAASVLADSLEQSRIPCQLKVERTP